MFRKILREMALHLNNAAGERNLVMHCADLKPLFAQARRGPKIMPRINCCLPIRII